MTMKKARKLYRSYVKSASTVEESFRHWVRRVYGGQAMHGKLARVGARS
jgi:hypothetical protein